LFLHQSRIESLIPLASSEIHRSSTSAIVSDRFTLFSYWKDGIVVDLS